MKTHICIISHEWGNIDTGDGTNYAPKKGELVTVIDVEYFDQGAFFRLKEYSEPDKNGNPNYYGAVAFRELQHNFRNELTSILAHRVLERERLHEIELPKPTKERINCKLNRGWQVKTE